MIIHNNLAALQTLSQMNKNTKKSEKASRELSTGEKITSASDSASEFSISEKMRVQIRALNQCTDNSKKGRTMLDTAAAAVSEQVEIMKKIRTLAMRCSDGVYTDQDRSILQEEVNQLLDECDDLANETNFNGIPLLNISEPTDDDSSFQFNVNGRNILNPEEISIIPDIFGNGYDNMKNVNKQGVNGQSLNTSYELDFTKLSNNAVLIPESLNDTGFSVFCTQGCGQHTVIHFLSNTDESSYEVGQTGTNCYNIGIKSVKNPEDLSVAIFNGIKNLALEGKITNYHQTNKLATFDDTHVQIGFNHNLTIGLENGKLFIGQLGSGKMYNGIVGITEGVAATKPEQTLRLQSDTKSSQYLNLHLPNTTTDVLFAKNKTHVPKLTDFPDVWPEEFNWNAEKNRPMTESEKARKWADEVWKYPMHGTTEDEMSVRTREKASEFIDHVDQALKYLITVNTELGAQSNRLNYTEANLITAAENTTGSESTIRDANMAKSMVEFTKNNILVQASQSMLAQANQTPQGVLSLLQ